MAILIKNAVTAGGIATLFEYPSAVEPCSVRVFPTRDIETVVRITGVCLSTRNTRKLTHGSLELLSATEGRKNGPAALPYNRRRL